MGRDFNFFKWAVLLVVPVILWGFYWYVGFDRTLVKYILFITAVLLLLFNAKNITSSFRKRGSYDKTVSILFLIILFSFIIAFIYWGQSPILTFRAAAGQFCILYYFILKKYRVNYIELGILVTVFASIYVILWFIALAAAPLVLFGDLDEIENNRGFFRVLQLNGIDTLCLFFFMCLVNLCQKGKKRRIFWSIAAFFSYIIIFLSLSRNLFFCLSIIAIVFLFIYNKKVLAIFSIFLIFGGYSLIANNRIVRSLTTMTQIQINEKSESNLRIVEYTQFSKIYPFHIGTLLFGNGEPHVESSYGQREEQLKDSLGFNRSDAGYVHVIVSYGLVMLLIFILLFYRIIKQKVGYEQLYYKMFIYLLIIVNVLSSTFFVYAVSFMISLYALELARVTQYHGRLFRIKNHIIYGKAQVSNKHFLRFKK